MNKALHILLAALLLSAVAFGQAGFVITTTFPTSANSFIPSSLTFGNQTQGTTSAAQTVVLTSVGGADVAIASISLGTANYTITANTCGNLLLKNGTCVLSIAFTPTTTGVLTDLLTIISNTSDSPQLVTETGTGTAIGATAGVSLSTSSLTFPSTIAGNSSATQTVVLTSSGSGTLTITSISITGTNSTDFSKTTTCGGSLATTLTCNVVVTFSPAAAGSKTATLVFTTNAASSPDNVSLSGTAIASGGSGFTLSPVFGFTQNNTSVTPSVQFGLRRIHDSPPLNWPAINTALHTYNWTSLDTQLQTDFDNGITEEEFQIGRTPPWASSNQTATGKCSYESTTIGVGNTDPNGKGLGECYPPTDLAANGSGTNLIWKTWNTDLEAHVHNSAYLNGTGVWAAHGANCNRDTPCKHTLVKYIEPWNEPDTGLNNGNAFYIGSIAQLARLVEDAACIWTGSQSGRRVIHQSAPATTATPCTATPVLNTALIVMPPTHGKGVSVSYTQLELYCNNVTGSYPSAGNSFQLPCPVVPNAMAAQVDIIAEHFKPGAEGTTAHTCGPTGTTLCSIETAMQLYVANIEAVLANSPNLTALPMWDDEAGIAPGQWTDPCCTAYIDPDMQRSFYPRFWLSALSVGIDAIALYTYDSMVGTGLSATHGGQSAALPSYTQSQTLFTGAVLPAPCSIVSGQLWSCTLTKGGNTYKVMWDASKSCSGGTCTTAVQNVTGFNFEQDFTIADTPHAMPGSHNIAIGIKAILFSN